MKDSRISKALGYIGDDISREAIEEFDKKSVKIDSTVPEEKPRVIRDEKSHKAPFMIALAGLCAAAIAAPLVLRNVGNSPIISGAAASPDNSYAESVESALDLGKSIAANVVKLRVSMDGDEVSAVRDDENPNVNFVTVRIDKTKSNQFAIVVNEDGTFSTFTGEDASEENALAKCPDGQCGMRWSFEGDSDTENYEMILPTGARKALTPSAERISKNIHTSSFWFATSDDVEEYWQKLISNGRQLTILDDGCGTFTARVDQRMHGWARNLRLSAEGDKLKAVLDDENPNVRFFTVKFDKTFNNRFGIIAGKDGTIELFEGDSVSEEKIIENLPDDKFGFIWTFEDGGNQTKCSETSNTRLYHNTSIVSEKDGLVTTQFWLAERSDIKDVLDMLSAQGGSIEIIDNGDWTYSAYISPYSSLTDDSGISVNVKEVKITLTDDKQLSVRDDENPNARIFTINLDKSKAKVQAFVINKDGTYKTFSGNDITKEDILRECPDGVSGVMWSSYTKTESSLFDGEGSNPAFNGTFEYKGNDLWSYEYWYSDDEEVKRACWDYGFDESGYPLRLKDNGDGTYTVYPDVP